MYACVICRESVLFIGTQFSNLYTAPLHMICMMYVRMYVCMQLAMHTHALAEDLPGHVSFVA
jgi:hypothetical protein